MIDGGETVLAQFESVEQSSGFCRRGTAKEVGDTPVVEPAVRSVSPRLAKPSNLTAMDALSSARRTLAVEAREIEAVASRLGDEFALAVETLRGGSGKVIVSGVGKSGLISRKIAATLCSTGTPSLFLHPNDALHGDVGVVASGDVLLALSNSGESQELLALLPLLRSKRVPIVALVGDPSSTLASGASVVIDVGVSREACPLGFVPTASTTAMMAVGDALAVALMEFGHFDARQLGELHPAGALGRRLALGRRSTERVAHIMDGGKLPLVRSDETLRAVIAEMTSGGFGAVAVTSAGQVCGLITATQLSRALESQHDSLALRSNQIMSAPAPIVRPDLLAADALQLMIQNGWEAAIVYRDDQTTPGVIDLQRLRAVVGGEG